VVGAVKPMYLKSHGHEVIEPALDHEDFQQALDTAYAAIHSFHGNDQIALLRAAELEALTGRPQKVRTLLQQAVPEMDGFPQHRLLQANLLIFLRDWLQAEADP